MANVTPMKSSPAIKKSKETKMAEYDAKHNKMIRGQFLTYGMKGVKEMQLTYKITEGNVHKKYVKHGDILELPYGYVKYLNNHGSIKREGVKKLKPLDADGNPISIRVEDNEPRYFFRVLDILSSEEMAELDPTTIVKANFV